MKTLLVIALGLGLTACSSAGNTTSFVSTPKIPTVPDVPVVGPIVPICPGKTVEKAVCADNKLYAIYKNGNTKELHPGTYGEGDCEVTVKDKCEVEHENKN